MRGFDRWSAVLVATLVAAVAPCGQVRAGVDVVYGNGFEARQTCDLAAGPNVCPGFEIQTPQIIVGPGEVQRWCYFFRAPNATLVAARRIASTLGDGTHSLFLFATYDGGWSPRELAPPGTVSQANCELFVANPGVLHVAHDAEADIVLPADQGDGMPLAAEIGAGQFLVAMMRVVNVSDEAITTSSTVRVEGYPPGTAYVRSASYATYDGTVQIPPMAIKVESQTCPQPPGAGFWWLSTRTRRFGIGAQLANGAANPIVETTDWEHPAVLGLAAPNFFSFGNGLRYTCTYSNTTNTTIAAGDGEQSDEVCTAIGHFAPATRPSICFNSVGPL